MCGGTTPRVLIVGAGPTGLLLAQGLKQAGIASTVFEREGPAASRREGRDWGMSMHWGGAAVAKLLPARLYARLHEAFVDREWKADAAWTLNHYDGSTGELVMETPMQAGATRVGRSRMRELFGEGIDVQYGKKLESIVQDDAGVTAMFEDGTRAVGSVLVGCDGSRSVVRKLLVGDASGEPRDLGLSVMNFAVKFEAPVAERVKAQHPIAFNTYHPKNWMFWVSPVDVPDAQDPASWLVQVMFFYSGYPRKEDLTEQAARTAFLKAKSDDYVDPWRSILAAIPDDVSFGIDHLHEWQPFDWSSMPLANRVTLAGDAAHTLTPYRGQGLNSALEDAAVLCAALQVAEATPVGLQAALRAYECEMIPRTRLEVQISSQAAAMAHNFEMLKDSPLAKLGVRRSRREDVA